MKGTVRQAASSIIPYYNFFEDQLVPLLNNQATKKLGKRKDKTVVDRGEIKSAYSGINTELGGTYNPLKFSFNLLRRLFGSTRRERAEGQLRQLQEYSGLYDIELFTLNEDTILLENPIRWQELIIGDDMLEAVRFKGDSVAFANVQIDKQELILYGDLSDLAKKRQEVYNELGIADHIYYGMDSILIARKKIDRFFLEKVDSTTLQLKGKIKNDSIFITAKKRPLNLKEFRLKKRRFHWLNEASYFY